MIRVFVDLRGFQIPAAAEKGCSGLTRRLLARSDAQLENPCRLVGLADPKLPAPDAQILASIDEVLEVVPRGRPGDILLEPSPLTHPLDRLFPLLFNRRVFKAAIVFNIASHRPDSSGAAQAETLLSCGAALMALRRFDQFLTFSEESAQALQRLLFVEASSVHVVNSGSGDGAADECFGAILAAGHQAHSRAAVMRRNRRTRLALITPLPPDTSRVAAHSARLIEALTRHADIDVFTDTGFAAPPPSCRVVGPISAFPFVSGAYDEVVAVIGNASSHRRVTDNMRRFGAACIAHADPFETAFPGEFAYAAHPLIVHEPNIQTSIGADYGLGAACLPLCPSIVPLEAALEPAFRAGARQRIGLSDDELVIIALGAPVPGRGMVECVWTIEILRSWGVNAKLYLLCEADDQSDALRNFAQSIGVGEMLHVVPEISGMIYQDYLLGADAALECRTGRAGGAMELSDVIAAGLPAVANVSLAEALGSPSYVGRVPDNLSPFLMAERILELTGRERLGADWRIERAAYLKAHSFERYADALMTVLGFGTA